MPKIKGVPAGFKRGKHGAMPKGTFKGLTKYGKGKKTRDIASDLSKHPDIKDPEALAVWIRRQSIGSQKFRRNQVKAAARRAKGLPPAKD